MTQDVLVTISGLHVMEAVDVDGEENAPIEIITPAKYFEKNGKEYILYEEVVEGFSGTIKNKVKITGDSMLEIIKTGVTNSHMVFENGKSNVTFYDTPYGRMHVEIHTRSLDIKKSEDMIDIDVDYTLDINCEPAAECRIIMNIKSK